MRTSSGNSRERTDVASTPLDAKELRKLLRQHKVRFKGPAHRSTWPNSYRHVFSVIAEIGRQEFDSYSSDGAEDLLSINATKSRTREIVEAARKDSFWGPVNESTLRHHVEDKVFGRFASEIKCEICRKKLWVSKFTALPRSPAKATKLQRDRAEGNLCGCEPSSRTWDNFEDRSETFLFRDFCDEIVKPDPAEELRPQGLQQQKPDRVFGLNSTQSLQHYTQTWPNVRHTPFSENHLLYPFLIIEAKSGRNGAGFENIEAQTGFPLLTCIKLQRDLKRTSGQPLQPLVWFMGYRGDEWRLAACIIDDEYPGEMHVYDLWMGRTLSCDGALQLLHIVDYLCDWARSVYRQDILTCLAEGRDAICRLTPAATSQASVNGSIRLATEPLGQSQDDHDMDEIVEVTDFRVCNIDPWLNHNSTREITQHDDGNSSEMINAPLHPWLKWKFADTEWMQNGTIRHSNMVRFRYTHLKLPEHQLPLKQCLRSIRSQQHDTVESIARRILISYMDRSAAFTTTLKYIDRVRCEWLKVRDDQIVGEDLPVRAWFTFATKIHDTDWQIERGLWCMTCTQQAAHCLSLIAGLDLVAPETLFADSVITYDIPLSTFSSLRFLTGNEAVTAAMDTKVFDLTVCHSTVFTHQYNCRWTTRENSDSRATRTLRLLFNDALADSGLLISVYERCETREVVTKPLSRDVEHLLRIAPGTSCGALLLRKGTTWPAETPQWCLMVLKELDFEDDREMGQLLRAVVMCDSDIYAVMDEESSSSLSTSTSSSDRRLVVSNWDERFFGEWIEALER